MMRQMIGLVLVMFLTSCATQSTQNYTRAVKSWRGANINQVVKQWGVPDGRVTNMDGNTAFIYKTQTYRAGNGQRSPAVGISMGADGKPVVTSGPRVNLIANRGITLNCLVVFVANPKGMIIETQIKGKNCYASQAVADRLTRGSAVR